MGGETILANQDPRILFKAAVEAAQETQSINPGTVFPCAILILNFKQIDIR